MPDPTTRRFRPTPAWLIVGLLVVEGLLWLSERWFPKGWAVLIAVVVGVATVLMLLWFVVALVFRWRFQFSIRSLLVLTLAVAVPFSWLAVEMKAAARQKEVVEKIMKLGRFEGMTYDHQLNASGNYLRNAQVPGPPWLRKLLGDDFFGAVVILDLNDSKITDAGLVQLTGLIRLKALYLVNTRITDAGLAELTGLTQLRLLILGYNPQITDEGEAKLQHALPNCIISR
jgi:hypothetical protein